MRRLRAFSEELRAEGRGEVPEFDPLDGGEVARLLFLLEKPGPGVFRHGAGFVSRDNPDLTAAAIFRFAEEAGIDRGEAVLWNAMPWWNGTIRYTAAEWRAGVGWIEALLDLLPRLAGVALVGRPAQRARPVLEGRGLRIVESAHPSPNVRAAFPERWRDIPRRWAELKEGG